MKLKAILGLGLALSLFASCAPAADKAPEKKEIGLQLYSVRNLMNEGEKYDHNLPDLLKALSEMGYTQVEAAGYGDGKFYGLTPEEYAQAAADAGLKVTSSHTGRPLNPQELESGDLTEYLAFWNDLLDNHKAAGIEYVVLPWMSVPATTEELAKQVDALNKVGAMATEKGLKFGYHNHSHEFRKVEDNVMLEYMIENTNPDDVFFELDVYWAMMGQASPVDLFNKYPGRFKLLHIKDRREIGQSGMVGFDAIFNNAETAGVENFFVEMEAATNSMEEGVAESAQYLINAPFVKATYEK